MFIGWALPHQVRMYVRDVSKLDIIRRDLRVFYNFTIIDDDTVSVRISMGWKVFN